MTAQERHRRAMELFDQAREMDAMERGPFLARACAEHAGLQREVELLLAHDVEPLGFLHQVEKGAGAAILAHDLASADSHTPAHIASGSRVGDYTVIRLIAEGGMGTVYEAHQEDPRRIVALKVVRADRTGGNVARRLRQEAHLLGQLQHPGIATVYDAGTADIAMPDGRVSRQPFFAMEFIRGRPIDQYVQIQRLDPRSVLALFIDVCEAVSYAHDRGVIHRDLKPANILVDAQGRPKVLDFGVARISNEDWRVATIETQTGQIVGTVQYMSPEQIGEPTKVDVRSDIYALGVLLYKLLSDRLPHDIRNATIYEAVRIIQDSEPTQLGSIDRRFRGDIELVVLKAMEKDPARRYQTVGELIADIRRHLSNEPIGARPASAVYQMRKFVRRNRAVVVGLIATITALLAGLTATTYFALRESSLRIDAEKNETAARVSELSARRLAYRAGMTAAADAFGSENVVAARRHLATVPDELRGWEWWHFNAQLDTSILAMAVDGMGVSELRWNRAGTELVSMHISDQRQEVHRWDAGSGRPKAAISARRRGHFEHRVAVDEAAECAVYVSDDDTVHHVDFLAGLDTPLGRPEARVTGVAVGGAPRVVAIQTEPGEIWVGSAIKSGVRRLGRVSGSPWSLHVSPNGAAIAVVTSECLNVLDSNSGEVLLRGGPVYSLAWSPDSRRIAAANNQANTITCWSLSPPRESCVLTGHANSPTSVAFSMDGRSVLTGSFDQSVRVWDAEGCAGRMTLNPGCRPWACNYSPDQTEVVFGSDDGRIEVWDVGTGNRVEYLRGLKNACEATAFSRDGKRIAAGDKLGNICVWQRGARNATVLRGHENYVYPVAISPKGDLLASGGWDKTIRLWDARTGIPVAVLRPDSGVVISLSFDPSGTRLLAETTVDDSSRAALVMDLSTGERHLRPIDSAHGNTIAFHADGKHIWLPRPDATVVLWDFQNDRLMEHPISALKAVSSPAVSAQFGVAAILKGQASDLHLIDMDTGVASGPLVSRARRVRFTLDGARFAVLLSSSNSNFADRVEIWDTATATRLAELAGHAGDVFEAIFTGDGKRVFTAGRDKTIRVWDAETFHEIAPLRGHLDYVWSLALSPDDTRLFSGSGDHEVRIWDAMSTADRCREREEYLQVRQKLEPIARARFNSAGAHADLERLLDDWGLPAGDRRVAHHVLLALIAGG